MTRADWVELQQRRESAVDGFERWKWEGTGGGANGADYPLVSVAMAR